MAQINYDPSSGPRKTAPRPRARSGTRSTIPSIVTLARWQLRQTWRLLIAIGLGMLLAVVLVCAIPLYVQVSLSAGLRHTLAEDPQNSILACRPRASFFLHPRWKPFSKNSHRWYTMNWGRRCRTPRRSPCKFPLWLFLNYFSGGVRGGCAAGAPACQTAERAFPCCDQWKHD